MMFIPQSVCVLVWRCGMLSVIMFSGSWVSWFRMKRGGQRQSGVLLLTGRSGGWGSSGGGGRVIGSSSGGGRGWVGFVAVLLVLGSGWRGAFWR